MAPDRLEKVVGKLCHLTEERQRGARPQIAPGKLSFVLVTGSPFPLSFGGQSAPGNLTIDIGVAPTDSDDRVICVLGKLYLIPVGGFSQPEAAKNLAYRSVVTSNLSI